MKELLKVISKKLFIYSFIVNLLYSIALPFISVTTFLKTVGSAMSFPVYSDLYLFIRLLAKTFRSSNSFILHQLIDYFVCNSLYNRNSNAVAKLMVCLFF